MEISAASPSIETDFSADAGVGHRPAGQTAALRTHMPPPATATTLNSLRLLHFHLPRHSSFRYIQINTQSVAELLLSVIAVGMLVAGVDRMARRRSTGEQVRRRRAVAVAVGGLALIAAVLLSPLLLAWATTWRLEWTRLSDVGQAYGTISAVLSALAFYAVAISILLQRSQYRLIEEQAVRQRHFELLTFAMEHPRYMAAWGGSPSGSSHDPSLITFANLIMSHWYMLWRIGNISETDLRTETSAYFVGPVGREFWQFHGHSWLMAPDPLARRFLDIVWEEFHAACRAGPPLPNPALTNPQPDPPEASPQTAPLLRGGRVAVRRLLPSRPVLLATGVVVASTAIYLRWRRRSRYSSTPMSGSQHIAARNKRGAPDRPGPQDPSDGRVRQSKPSQ
ncbi:DUF6082 family protein [Dactylosporangium sp. AC04546]|uniref:DUF6082 family protein n=1 Tax=Dactylosporangium sp. AC04546 TaxID=2862460 RepID=UPI001EDE277A|nr:DUF6082 family protein [Dactylosporangium sp. AC04546]WVK78953.1 DUF6082 family protein [Dactylosporangium sp. AC04546]